MKLAGELRTVACPCCGGLGRLPCPKTFSVRTSNWNLGFYTPVRQAGEGFPIPCPMCSGKKVVPSEAAK